MTVAPPGAVQPAAAPAESVFVKGRRTGFKPGADHAWLAGTFATSFAVYFAVGYRTVVQQHVVPYDAIARLAHAFFVWHNAPPKLAAVGFVWPPLATIVFLPFAAFRPLATSLVALPLTSALFGAATVVVGDRTLAALGMSTRLRVPLLVAFALNPMILYYSANGMSEIVYLAFLTFGVYAFVRWVGARESRWIVLCAAALSLGVLSRYEVVGWAALLAALFAIGLVRRFVTREEVEGTLIAYAAPIAYALGLWLFLNWLIVGNPLFFVSRQAPGFAQSTAVQQVQEGHVSLGAAASGVLDVNWRLFPAVVVVTAALVAVAVVRRDLVAAAIATVIGVNAVATVALMVSSGNEGLLQLRYNMRAIPLALAGIGWLHHVARGRLRGLVWLAALVALVASAPSTWRTMRTYRYQFLEQAFVRALATGRSQEGTSSEGGYVVGTGPERATARWILAHVHRRDAILTDDAQTFPVMLFSGRPDLFFDRIDYGDARWLGVRDAPFGKVRYFLVSRIATDDLIRIRWPRLFHDPGPDFREVYRSERYVVFRLVTPGAGTRPG